MNKMVKKTVEIILLLLIGLTLGVSQSAECAVTGQVKINPEEPWPGSDVAFTVDVDADEIINDVRLIVRECKESICFSDAFNETMDQLEPGRYQCMITLRHSDATYIDYQVRVRTDEGWYYIPGPGVNNYMKTFLTGQPGSGSDDGGTDNGNDDGRNKINGFELILLILALIVLTITFIIVRRRR